MPTTSIVAKYVNSPQAGKKSGTIKTPEGVYYGIQASWVGQFTQGASYDIEYKENDFNGKTYKNITKFVMSQTAPAQTNGGASAGSGSTYKETSARDAERMFVCSLLNAAIQAGKMEIKTESLAGAVNILRDVWALTFGAAPRATTQQQRSNLSQELDDSIDF